jgi:hypothetical protein
MVFSDLWAGRAVTTTLSPKFGSPTQRWGRAGQGGRGAASKSRAPAPWGDQRSPPSVGGPARKAATLGCSTHGAAARRPAACGRRRGPGPACRGLARVGLDLALPLGPGLAHPALWARARGVGRPPLPWGGAPPPTVGLRQRSFVIVMGVHNLEIMAPIFGS